MKTPNYFASRSRTGEAIPPMSLESLPYKTIAIYPNFDEVGSAVALLKSKGFTSDQISVLGREQEHWQERLSAKWEALHTTEGALQGAALGAIPGLALVVGVALTGGAGVLAAGPMVAALEALGLGALGGGLMGGASNNLDSTQKEIDIEAEVEDAVGHGQWVIVAHSHDATEALRAQALLPESRIILEAGSDAKPH